MSKHGKFRFINYGGSYMLRLETADDLQALPLLDEPFWIATSAPIHHLRCDQTFLAFLDHDSDGRIRSDDIRRAYGWLSQRLANLDGLTHASETLTLSHLAPTPEAAALDRAARRILSNLGKSDADHISLQEVRNHQAYQARGEYNGDGIIPPDAIEDDEELRTFAADIIATVGGSVGINGILGIAERDLAAFLKASNEILAWRARSDADSSEHGSLFPLGEATAAAHARLNSLREPVDLYFRLCQLTAVDQMLGRSTIVPPSTATIQDTATTIDESLLAAPIAAPTASEVLHLDEPVNPAYREALAHLVSDVLQPVLGENWSASRLTAAEWARVKETFCVYESWLGAKSGGEVEKLGPEKLQSYLAGPLPERLRHLIKADEAVGVELSVVKDLEHLLLMQRWFMQLANNFVSFHDLYNPKQRALFEMGRMIIGGRVFNLNLQVKDINVHSALAAESGILLLYSEVTCADKSKTFYVVTPVTSMTLGRLKNERRGVLFDLDEQEWDVRVVKVLDNPISLWDAILKPFKRVIESIANAFNRIVSGTEKQLDTSLTQSFTEVEKKVTGTVAESTVSTPAPAAAPAPAPPPPPPPLAPAAKPGAPAPARPTAARDWMLSGSVAVAALGSSFAFVTSRLAELSWKEHGHKILIVVAVGLILILVPTIIISWLRLRKRNLGSLLEASGWAINAEMRVTRRLAKVLAPRLKHPAGFLRIRKDYIRLFARQAKESGSTAKRDATSDP